MSQLSKVAEAKGFGLLGEYFNNRWIFGEPVVTRVDAKIDFTWSEADTLTPTGQDYISVRYVSSRVVYQVVSLPFRKVSSRVVPAIFPWFIVLLRPRGSNAALAWFMAATLCFENKHYTTI